MRKLVIAAAMSTCLLSQAAIASADLLFLRDGTRVSGTVISVAEGVLTFEDTLGAVRRYDVDRVDAVEFSLASQRSDVIAADGTRLAVLAAGTELAVRTTEAIDSSTAVVGQTFSAIVEHDIVSESRTLVVPAGSSAVLVVREISSGGITGSPDMVLDLESMTVSGRRYVVSTEDLERDTGTGIGANRRTAEVVGGGAAIGTIIGAIAGGARGAGLGALVGAAGGAAVQILNRGQDVRVPAETLLTFTLGAPASLHAAR